MRDQSAVAQRSAVHTTPCLSEHEHTSPADPDITRETTVQRVFQNITSTFGISFVPELFEGMRHRPSYLDTTWRLFKNEMKLECLDRRTRRIIALAISTNEAGAYFMAAMPGAFRVNALNPATCDTIVSAIRLFTLFDRYLSGLMPDVAPDTVTFVNNHLREEYLSEATTRVSHLTLSGPAHHEEASGIGGLIIMIALLSFAAGIYWFI